MRRFALTLLASLSVALVTGCSGYGGSAIGGGDSSTYDALVFNTAGGVPGVFEVAASVTPVALTAVAPVTTTPLIVSTQGSKSSFAITQFNTTATWSTTYAWAPTTWFKFQETSGTAAPANINCPANPPGGFANPASALVMQAPGSTGWIPYAPGTFLNTIGVVPVAAQAGPPALNPPAAATSTAAIGPGSANAVAGYCLIVVATASNGTQGSFVVFVGN